MNISPISVNHINFGQVKRSAVRKAIKEANGNVQNLEFIRDCIVDQKDNNRYHIYSISAEPDFNYLVMKPGTLVSYKCMTLSEACDCATKHKLQDEYDDRIKESESKHIQRKSDFDEYAQVLLASCEE